MTCRLRTELGDRVSATDGVRKTQLAIEVVMALDRLPSRSSSSGMHTQPPLIRVEYVSRMLASKSYDANWNIRVCGLREKVDAMTFILLERAWWLHIMPFGVPVLPEVNKINAGSSGED
jgi:hypothetical protein